MVRRDVPDYVKVKLEGLIRESIEFARGNPGSADNYMRKYASEMRKEIMNKHVDTFVNEYSLSLGKQGRAAVMKLLETGSRKDLFPNPPAKVFV